MISSDFLPSLEKAFNEMQKFNQLIFGVFKTTKFYPAFSPFNG